MMQWIKFVLMGILFWLLDAVFFRLLGTYVLLSPGETYFTTSLLLLLAVKILVFAGISLFVRLKMYRDKGAATRFGYWLALAGLVMNGFILWHQTVIFPAFTPGEHEAYAICIIFACAVALWVPRTMDSLIREPKPVPQEGPSVQDVDILDEHHPSPGEPTDGPYAPTDDVNR